MSLVFAGGRILTFDPRYPNPASVAVDDDRIGAVSLAPNGEAPVVDLAGKTLLPGFVDAHNHLSRNAFLPVVCDMASVAGHDEALRRIANFVAAERESEVVVACGFDERLHGKIRRRDLDAIGDGRPILVEGVSVHQGVASSAALEMLEVSEQSANPPGGIIGRSKDGTLNGVLFERAWSPASALIRPTNMDPARHATLIERRARLLLTHGITTVGDAACSPEAEEAYARAGLPLDVVVMPHPASLFSPADVSRLDGPPSGEGNVGPVKIFADGGPRCRIEASIGGIPVTTGLAFGGMRESAVAAAQRGWNIAIHAMGNAALGAALDAFEDVRRLSGGDALTLRIEHVTLASAAHVARMKSLGVIASVQPGFVEILGRSGGTDVQFDGLTWMPFASLLDAGVAIAASSDDPCGVLNPLEGAAYGESRIASTGHEVAAGETVPFGEWLRAYTIGSATAVGKSADRGSITPGKRADFVVIDDGARDASGIAQTWVGGRCLYDRDAPRNTSV